MNADALEHSTTIPAPRPRVSSRPRLKVVPASPVTPPTAPRPSRPAKAPPGVVAQVRMALKPQNRLATTVGAIVGGLVPLASYQLSHHEIVSGESLWSQPAAWLVLGGLVFSALTVAGWARAAFGGWSKAVGFTVLVEGCLLVSRTPWLGFAALGVLVGINAVAAGVRLSRGA